MEPYYSMNYSQGRNCNPNMNSNCRQNNPNFRRTPPGSNYPPCANRPSCGSGKDTFHKPNPAINPMRNQSMNTMMVDCACKTTSSNCYKEDSMNQLGSRFPLAMAYVPWQQWGDLYDIDCSLMHGTLFKDLDLEFCGVRC